MGYNISNNTPKFVFEGQTYCVAAFDWDTPIGLGYKIGVFIKTADGTWNLSSRNHTNGTVVDYMNHGDVLADMKAKGGKMEYLKWLVAKVNSVMAKLFAPIVLEAGEPVTDRGARDVITAYIPTLKVTLVDGIPVLSL